MQNCTDVSILFNHHFSCAAWKHPISNLAFAKCRAMKEPYMAVTSADSAPSVQAATSIHMCLCSKSSDKAL
jgi:hypothetical protein